MRKVKTSVPVVGLNADGTLFVGSLTIKIPDYSLQREIGRGVSGVVFLCQHVQSKKLAAVKIWVALKAGDVRDKFRQGIEEAKKASDAGELTVTAQSRSLGPATPSFLNIGEKLNWRSPGNSISAVRIHHTGEIHGFVYAIMDYCAGITLRKWLIESTPQADPPKNFTIPFGDEERPVPPEYGKLSMDWYAVGPRWQKGPPSLGMRWNLGMQLLLSIGALAACNLTHGDLHADNILVVPNSNVLLGWMPPDFRIVDFGTSYFTSKNYSIKRHWRVIDMTMSELMSPFDIDYWCEDLRGQQWTSCLERRIQRLETFLVRVYCVITDSGLPEYGYGALSLKMLADSERLTPILRKKLDELIQSRKLELSESTIGSFLEWYPFDY